MLISIIIPVYNVEKHLNQCVSSVVNQTYKDIEIILVNDGSSDNSPRICDEWAEKDSRIRVIHKNNGGVSSARNTGLKVAKGDYIGFIDSDDYIDKNMYEKLLSCFNDEGIGIASCGVFYDKEGNISPYNKSWMVSTKKVITYNEFPFLLLPTKVNFTIWSKLYKRELLEGLKFREGLLNEDSLFIFDLSFNLEKKKQNMVEIPYVGYYYRCTPGGITQNKIKPLEIDVIENYESMATEALMRHKPQLSHTIMQYRNKRLYLFLIQIMKTKDYHMYFEEYYHRLKETPLIDLIHTNENSYVDTIKILLLRFFPRCCKLRYRIKDSIS
jgi:glycosyltransferase involved in cell wall biosynthesis